MDTKGYDDADRCPWVDLTKPDYVEYHDHEWGVPVHDDNMIFEFLTLEGAQAGLSWYTVLRKRDAYRKAFAGFDPEKVARFGKRQIESLLKNDGIIPSATGRRSSPQLITRQNSWTCKKSSAVLTRTFGVSSMAGRSCIVYGR
jgi:DNA-3-methyladenine glycosylase I